jgi:diguanylate cyclase (GGDEF)-like protein
MVVHQSQKLRALGEQTHRRLIVTFIATSFVPVLLLAYVSLAYLLPAVRAGQSIIDPAALQLLLVGSLILCVAGFFLVSGFGRRLRRLGSSIGRRPTGLTSTKDELRQLVSEANRLRTKAHHQKDEIWQLKQQQSLLRTEIDAARQKAPATLSEGIWNDEGWQDYVSQEVERARRYRRSFCIAFVKIERFQDRIAHLSSEEKLEIEPLICEKVRSWLRSSDLMAGSAHQYLVILLPETDNTGGRKVAERLAARLPDEVFVLRTNREIDGFRASIGIAGYPSDAAESSALVECARTALAFASESGAGTTVAAYDRRLMHVNNRPPAR